MGNMVVFYVYVFIIMMDISALSLDCGSLERV